jgi:hypothetical protein
VALVGTVLPWLETIYGAHLASASSVSEAPVMETLLRARATVAAEIRDGARLLGDLPDAPTEAAGASPDVTPA